MDHGSHHSRPHRPRPLAPNRSQRRFLGKPRVRHRIRRYAFHPGFGLGLADFSHILVVYCFHLVPDESVVTGASHPRGNPDWPRVGIFAQRKKDRPNKLGVSVCELLEVDGLKLKVKALDAIDGTPVLDIKPYVREFEPDPARVRQPQWMTELMRDYFS